MIKSETIGFAMFNKFKTGNEVADTFLIILIPAFISFVFTYINKLLLIKDFINSIFDKRYIIWNIDDNKQYLSGYTIGVDFDNNSILREAIMLYIGKLKLDLKKSNMKFKLKQSDISNYTNNILPYEYKWIKITETVDFYYGTRIISEKEQSQILRNIKLRTKHNVKDLENFIKDAIECYKEINYENINTKYMYTLYDIQVEKNETSLIWKKYELISKKTINSVFFPEKKELIKLVDNFMNGTGKYSIPVYPKKLGLLLHGPPGTGKSSLIKALASYTKRHILIIPISRIETNQQLFDILFDKFLFIKDRQIKDTISPKDVIYVIEDIDAATDVLDKRKKGTDKIEDLIDKTEDLIDKTEDEKKSILKLLENKDKLNLSGVLNALDGILESENRMLIITTNHVEKLDPAFIRPGRIDKILKLDYVNEESAKNILNLYFNNQEINTMSIFENNKITPAEIEQKCAEYDTVAEVVDYFKQQQNST